MKFIITAIALLITTLVQAQLTDSTIFPLNEYLYTNGSNPYPLVNETKIKAINKSKIVNVLDFGAKGDGKTPDDAAIAKALESATEGLIFPAGKTFLMANEIEVTPKGNLTVYAYGATFKIKDKAGYAAIAIKYERDNQKFDCIWLGGTFDGNRDNQIWQGNPKGGEYNGPLQDSPGRFLIISFAKFAMFKDVVCKNTVMDAIDMEGNLIAVIANSKAENGARIDWAVTGKQSSYFKCTRSSSKAFYCINDTCIDGHMGIHYSTPTKNQALQQNTLTVINNCYFQNGGSNPVHMEDCLKFFAYNCVFTGPVENAEKRSIHLSNQTRVAVIQKCQFRNARINFMQGKNLKLSVISGCNFVSETNKLKGLITGPSYIVANSNFTGATDGAQIKARYVYNSKFSNFGHVAVEGASVVDKCEFKNGNTPATFRDGGSMSNSSASNTLSAASKSKSSSGLEKILNSRVDVFDNTGKYIGKLTIN